MKHSVYEACQHMTTCSNQPTNQPQQSVLAEQTFPHTLPCQCTDTSNNPLAAAIMRMCRAQRLADGVVVVVKEIKTTALSAKQKAATMDEVEVLAKLDHPNIVKYHDCFTDDVYINIVMEYCEAGDLATFIKNRHGKLLSEQEIMTRFVQVCGQPMHCCTSIAVVFAAPCSVAVHMCEL